MKNRVFYLFLGILLGFSFIGVVYAADYNVIISATPSATTIVKGEEATVMLNIKSDNPVEVCHFQVTIDSNIEFVTMSNVNSWEYDGSINNFTVENSDMNFVSPLTSGENVLQMKYKVNGDGKVTIKTSDCNYAGGSEPEDWFSDEEIDDVTIDFKIQDFSDVTTLSSLSVTKGGTMNESFDPNKTEAYFINLSSPNFGLEITATNPDYQDDIKVMNVDANKEITDISNIVFETNGQSGMPITITVNGKTTYTLVALYEQTELDNTLSSITINGKKLTLVEGKFHYEYTVGKDVSSFKVDAVIKDSDNFKFGEDSNAPSNFSIKDNVDIIIVVEPKNSSVGASSVTYTIRVTKESDKTEEPEEEPKEEEPGGNAGTGNNNGSSGNTNTNPGTGGVSIYVMLFILFASLIGSIVLYQKNLESYK